MQRQTEKATALHYRVAQKNTDNLYLDNQMQQLLCYAVMCRALDERGAWV